MVHKTLYPYWRLSAFYLFYYACLGAWIPYWPLYLQYIGHSAMIIGMTNAVFHSTRIIAPNLWGYIGDSTGQRLKVIRYGCLFAFLAILGLIWSRDIWLLALILFVFSFFWSAVLPQFEVLTLGYLGNKSYDYGRIRLWGSMGFIGAVFGAGALFDLFPLSFFPFVIAFVLMSLWLSSMVVPSQSDHEDKQSGTQRESDESFLQIVSKHHVWAFLLVVILVQVSFGPFYNFFSILLSNSGYPLMAVSAFWCVAITAEILVFMYIRHFYNWFGMRNLLLISIVFTVLRWLITGAMPDNIAFMVFAQMLHAFSFATFHACMVEQVRRLFPAKEHGKGQALFNSIGYGLGAVLGAAGSGLLWSQLGQQLFYLAAGVAFLALIVALLVLRHDDFSGPKTTDT